MYQVSRQDACLMTDGCLITQICKLCFLSCVLPCAVCPLSKELCRNVKTLTTFVQDWIGPEIGECGVMPNNNWFVALHQRLQQHLPLLIEQGSDLAGWGQEENYFKIVPMHICSSEIIWYPLFLPSFISPKCHLLKGRIFCYNICSCSWHFFARKMCGWKV